ncbi:MAG: hypothetical protein MUC97_04420 [Bernardetiaceae bacterium]|jgi:hypothetical protein|nr:hypothetical protein [Bernardetiaceae bacterium]
MRKLLFFIALAGLSVPLALAQTHLPDSTKIQLNWGVNDPALQDFYRATNVYYFRLTATDSALREQPFRLVVKEYKHRQLQSTDTLFAEVPADYLSSATGQVEIRLLCRYRNLDTVEFHFFYPRMSTRKMFRTLARDTYSLRDAINSDGQPVSFPVGQARPLWVYSLPYEDPKRPGYLFYCELTARGVPPERWGEHYGVPHYIIVELLIGAPSAPPRLTKAGK